MLGIWIFKASFHVKSPAAKAAIECIIDAWIQPTLNIKFQSISAIIVANERRQEFNILGLACGHGSF